MSLREKLLVERLITNRQRPEIWDLREYLKARRIRARRSLKAVRAATSDRPTLVVSGQPVGRSAVSIPHTGRTGRPAKSKPTP